MKTIAFTPALLLVAALVGACASGPRTTGLLETTRADYAAAERDPSVARFAPLELKQAGDAMREANAASDHADSSEKVDKLAYLARQKIALAQEAARQRLAEANVASAGKERDQIRLDQRTLEADKAKADAEQSRQAAQVAQNDATESQRKTVEAQARAARLEAQLADLAAKKTERGIVITLGDVLFGIDLALLTPDGVRTAKKLADLLQQNPLRTVLVEGYTDNTGTALHNQALSERRADAVRGALQEMGVARERIAARGHGQDNPVAANDTAQNRQLNRRVEILLSEDGAKVSLR